MTKPTVYYKNTVEIFGMSHRLEVLFASSVASVLAGLFMFILWKLSSLGV